MRTNSSLWSGMFVYLGFTGIVFGQATTSTQTTEPASAPAAATQISSTQSTLQAFQAEQLNLAQQQEALRAEGATASELHAWAQQNSAQLALQNQREIALGVASASALQRENRKPNIPANASPALKDLITARIALANAHAHIHNQVFAQVIASGQSLTPAQVSQLKQKENQLFQKQYGTQVSLLVQKAQAVTNAEAQTVRPVPPPVVIPANATPQEAAFLTTRSQIRRSRIQLMNQYANATPAVREAALFNWYKQNAAQFAQLRQESQSLSPATTTTN